MPRIPGRRLRRWRATTLALTISMLAAGTAAVPAHAARKCSGTRALPAEVGTSAIARSTLCLLNRERVRRGRRKLRANARLAGAAHIHAADMVAARYFSHVSLHGTGALARIRAAGYSGARRSRVGEIIAWGSGELATPRRIVRAWMRSRRHRAGILRRGFREVGVAAADGTPDAAAPVGATYVCTFGRGSRR